MYQFAHGSHRDEEELKQPEGWQLQPASCDNRILALECFLEIKEEQKSWSLMGIPRISILGLSDFLMFNGNMSKPCFLLLLFLK